MNSEHNLVDILKAIFFISPETKICIKPKYYKCVCMYYKYIHTHICKFMYIYIPRYVYSMYVNSTYI